MVGGAPEVVADDAVWQQEARDRASAGQPWREIAKELGERYGIPKNRIKTLLFSEITEEEDR